MQWLRRATATAGALEERHQEGGDHDLHRRDDACFAGSLAGRSELPQEHDIQKTHSSASELANAKVEAELSWLAIDFWINIDSDDVCQRQASSAAMVGYVGTEEESEHNAAGEAPLSASATVPASAPATSPVSATTTASASATTPALAPATTTASASAKEFNSAGTDIDKLVKKLAETAGTDCLIFLAGALRDVNALTGLDYCEIEGAVL
mmetsp:Transcript_102481/g.319297  ORF Transcript_102481/g.319297 Transcript_102481/m.319297 type:complete len:210 (+) Transcript_102481:234-863(+)